MKHKYSSWILAFIFVSAAIVVYKTVDNFNFITAFFEKVLTILSPFTIGLVIAYLLNYPARFFQRLIEKPKITCLKKHSKGIAIAIVYLLAFFVISVVMRIIIPAIIENILDVYENRNSYIDLVTQTLTNLEQQFGFEFFDPNKVSAYVTNYFQNIELSELGKYAQGVINITSGVISFFIAIVISVYMLNDKTLITDGIKRILTVFLPKKKAERFLDLCSRINDIFSKYLLSMILDGIIVGIVSTIIMSAFDSNYAVILGLTMGLFSLIPYFGAIVAVIICILVTLLTNGWFTALWVGVSLILFQQIDCNFIGPKIMGNMLKARPLLIIFAVTLGGGLFGLFGMIFSVPIAMAIKMILGEYIDNKENAKRSKQEE